MTARIHRMELFRTGLAFYKAVVTRSNIRPSVPSQWRGVGADSVSWDTFLYERGIATRVASSESATS
jgi:hypothetical protein